MGVEFRFSKNPFGYASFSIEDPDDDADDLIWSLACGGCPCLEKEALKGRGHMKNSGLLIYWTHICWF